MINEQAIDLQIQVPLVTSEPMTGEELREWREKHGLSAADLARELSVSYPTVFRWEQDPDAVGKDGKKLARDIPPYLELALKEIERRLKKRKAPQ